VSTFPRLDLGAPGVYERPPTTVRALTNVRMGVCAFVGVAPRGPARVPVTVEGFPTDASCVAPGHPRSRSIAVAVESFDEYVRLYGAFEGAGLLPFAVASFFDQGGRRAYVVRIVHDFGGPEDDAGVATGVLRPLAVAGGVPVALRARNEGSWGNKLTAALEFSARALDATPIDLTRLALAPDTGLPAGTLLRLELGGGVAQLRVVASVLLEGRVDGPGRRTVAMLDAPASTTPESVEIVEGTLSLDDGDGRTERHDRLGLSPAHPRFVADVLCSDSDLVYPDAAWIGRDVLPADAALPSAAAVAFDGGADRAHLVEPEDFFDDRWTFGDEDPGSGVHALVELADLSLVVVPDLYSPTPLEETETVADVVSLAGPTFERCEDSPPAPGQEVASDPLDGLALDPRLPDDRKKIVGLQQRLQDLADLMRSWIVLLDVPPGLNQRQILQWRAQFDSMFAAAYHPWLRVAPLGDRRRNLVQINPSATAAGIVARREHRFGVPFGPSNELALQVVDVAERVSPARHDELHPNAINVYLRERDGVRLTAARTLSRDPIWRQLSVRRLVTMLHRALDEQMQWAVFEPNTASLRNDIRHLLENYLRSLARANAFAGATDDESFFVRCDETLNPPSVVDEGKLIVEVGIAPAEPLEFIVLRIERDGDGTLTVETTRG